MNPQAVYLLVVTATVSAALLSVGGVVALERSSASVQRYVRLAVCAAYGGFLFLQPAFWPLSTLLVLLVAVVLGRTLAHPLSSRGAVLTFVAVIALVDWLSVAGGLSRWIIDSYRAGESAWLLYLSVSIPIGGRVVPVVGIGDMVIVSALFSALWRLGYPGVEVVGALIAGLVLALGIGLAKGGGGVAALPFIGLVAAVYVLARLRADARRFEKQPC